MDTLFQRLEIKSMDTAGLVEGYASTFGNVDHGKDRVMPGAFAETLKVWGAKSALPPMLWNHNDSDPVGEYLTMNEDAKGLHFTAQLWVEETYAEVRKALKTLKSTGVKGFSIGGRFAGQRDSKGIRAITAVDLHEVSVVPMPMNDHARGSIKSLAADDLRNEASVAQALQDIGFSDVEAKRFMARGFAAVDESTEILSIFSALKHNLSSKG